MAIDDERGAHTWEAWKGLRPFQRAPIDALHCRKVAGALAIAVCNLHQHISQAAITTVSAGASGGSGAARSLRSGEPNTHRQADQTPSTPMVIAARAPIVSPSTPANSAPSSPAPVVRKRKLA